MARVHIGPRNLETYSRVSIRALDVCYLITNKTTETPLKEIGSGGVRTCFCNASPFCLEIISTLIIKMHSENCIKNPEFKNVTVVATNPGGTGDSRCFSTNTPRSMKFQQRFIMKSFMSMIQRLPDPTFGLAAETSVIDLAELAFDEAHSGERHCLYPR